MTKTNFNINQDPKSNILVSLCAENGAWVPRNAVAIWVKTTIRFHIGGHVNVLLYHAYHNVSGPKSLHTLVA